VQEQERDLIFVKKKKRKGEKKTREKQEGSFFNVSF